MKKITFLSISVLYLLGMVFISCEKDEKQNPDDWTPQNLLLIQQSNINIEIRWEYDGPSSIDGFKIDRRAGSNDWIESIAILPIDARSWVDTNVVPDQSGIYYYRLYAFRKEARSPYVEKMVSVNMPKPDTLIVEKVSLTKYKIFWHYEYESPDAYQLERSYNEETWDVLTTTNDKYFFDSTFKVHSNIYYRVCAIENGYKSEYSKNTTYSYMPAPTGVNIKADSYNSLSLSWDFNATHPISHFIIDKQENSGSWVLEYAMVDATEKTFTDSNVDLETNDYSYAVYACAGTFESEKLYKSIIFACGVATLTDPRDSTEYETVQIGDYCWMKQNLAYLPAVFPPSAASSTTPLYYVYDYSGGYVPAAKATDNYQSYGVLYNHPAALDACPEVDGWHLPDKDEYAILFEIAGGEWEAINNLREPGREHWNGSWPEITNSTGFTAFAAGHRFVHGDYFQHLKTAASFWSSTTEYSIEYAYALRIWGLPKYTWLDPEETQQGFSVRCIKKTLY